MEIGNKIAQLCDTNWTIKSWWSPDESGQYFFLLFSTRTVNSSIIEKIKRKTSNINSNPGGMWQYLVIGIGCPWALHGMLTAEFSCRRKKKDLTSPRNAGALLPIGSTKRVARKNELFLLPCKGSWYYRYFYTLYLDMRTKIIIKILYL